jgi:hypothetical protein
VKKNIRINCHFPYVCCSTITPKFKWFLLVVYYLFFIYRFSIAQHSYTPELVDPLSEPWRWKEFPELVGKGVRNIVETNDGTIWFGIDKGIIKYDGRTWQTFNQDNGFVTIPVNQLCVEQGKTIYAGTDSGIFRYANKQWTRITNIIIPVEVVDNDHPQEQTYLRVSMVPDMQAR